MDGREARFDATAAALSGQLTQLRDEMREELVDRIARIGEGT